MRFFAVVMIATTCFVAEASALQDQVFNVVAKTRTSLYSGRTPIATVEKGEVMTVVDNQQNSYYVHASGERKGWLSQGAVARLKDSLQIYNDLIRQTPNRAAHYEARALVWWTLGDIDRLVADYGSAIKLGSKNPSVFNNRAIHLATQGQYDQAILDYTNAIKFGAKGPGVYINRGVAHFGKKDYDKAIADSVLGNRAAAKAASGDLVHAVDDYTLAIKQEPKNPTAYHSRGLAWRDLENYKQAATDFSEALRFDPKFTKAFMSRGFVYFLSDQPDKAVKDFTSALALDPNNALAINNRGYNYQLMGKYAEAVKDYRQAVRLAPKYALAYQNIAWLLATCPEDKIRNGKEALKSALEACKLREYQVATDVKSLAAAYAENGDFEKALHWQKKVLELMEEADDERKKEESEFIKRYEEKKPFRFSLEKKK